MDTTLDAIVLSSSKSISFLPPAASSPLLTRRFLAGHEQEVDAPCGMLKYNTTSTASMQVFFPKKPQKIKVESRLYLNFRRRFCSRLESRRWKGLSMRMMSSPMR